MKTEQQSEQWSGVSSWPKKEIITLTFLRFYMNVTLTPNLVLFVFFAETADENILSRYLPSPPHPPATNVLIVTQRMELKYN